MEVVYTNTSVFGGIFVKAFSESSIKLLESFKRGERKVMVSDLLLEELGKARQEVRQQVDTIPNRFQINTRLPLKARLLAAQYIAEGVLTIRSKEDALHIATATLQSADIVASWNFKHMANAERIKLFNKINKEWGFRSVTIKTPNQIINP